MKIAYCRKSRDRQDLTTQMNLVMATGVIPENVFADSETGATQADTRIGFMTLKTRIAKGDVDEVVVTEFSRLGRDAQDSIYEMLALARMNIKITSLAENERFISDLPREAQMLMISAMSLGADVERKHISERTRWSLALIKAGQKPTKSGRPLGRPKVIIDWEKIEKKKAEFGVSENMARKLCEYNRSTFYKEKKRLKEAENK